MPENTPKKIIITSLVPEPADHYGKTGGEVRLVEILKRLPPSDEFKIVVVATPKRAQYFRHQGIGAEFKIVKSGWHFKSLLGLSLKSLYIIAKSFLTLDFYFLKNKHSELVVYSSSDLFWEVIPAFFYKRKNKKIRWVQVIHHIYPDWTRRSGNMLTNFLGYYLQRFSLFLIRKRADKILVINPLVKNKLLDLKFDETKIFGTANGLNFDYFQDIQPGEPFYDGIFLGRLNYSKGIFDLVDIWKKVCTAMPGARLALLGGASRSMRKNLMEKIRQSGLGKNIDFLGFLDNEAAYSILKSGRVFLFPSHEEGWGMAVAEAMASDLPVVSWDLPVYREIFENYTVRVQENDIDSFSRAVIEFLKNEPLRKQVGNRGKKFIEKYSWNEVAARELELIKKLIKFR